MKFCPRKWSCHLHVCSTLLIAWMSLVLNHFQVVEGERDTVLVELEALRTGTEERSIYIQPASSVRMMHCVAWNVLHSDSLACFAGH